jgi:hypothetical protein
MKRILTILFFLYAYNVYSQGFPWELSPRFPFYIPVTYVGLDGYYAKSQFSGNMTLFENFYVCSKFDGGTGNAFALGATIEHWYWHNVALQGFVNFQTNRGQMVAQGDSFPVLIKGIPKIAKVENELSMDFKYLNFGVGVKWLPFRNNLYLRGLLEFGFKVSSVYEIYEQIKSPAEYHFIDNTQRRKVLEGRLSDLSLFKVEPKVCIGYDAPLFAGVYASPAITFDLPIYNFSKDETMRIFSIQFGLSLLFGIW